MTCLSLVCSLQLENAKCACKELWSSDTSLALSELFGSNLCCMLQYIPSSLHAVLWDMFPKLLLNITNHVPDVSFIVLTSCDIASLEDHNFYLPFSLPYRPPQARHDILSGFFS